MSDMPTPLTVTDEYLRLLVAEVRSLRAAVESLRRALADPIAPDDAPAADPPSRREPAPGAAPRSKRRKEGKR